MKLTLGRTLTVAAVVLACAALSAGRGMAEDGKKLPKEMLAADSQANFDQCSRFLHSGSTQMEMQAATEGLEKLGAAGHVVILDAGTQVKTIQGIQVRVLGGPHSGQVWWVFTDEDVRKPGEVPPGAIEAR
jgi:hypothetical protein